MVGNSRIPHELEQVIRLAQQALKQQVQELIAMGGMTPEKYIRFLSYQCHLTKGVQKHFFALAAHSDLADYKSLRKFLIQFGFDEEDHYLIAERDIHALQGSLLTISLDVKLWWAYFDRMVVERPFMRLGATCILENISEGAAEQVSALISSASFLNPRNMRFLEIHRHGEVLPHGSMILDELAAANLGEHEWRDLIQGAEEARIMYLRMVQWAFC